MVKNPPANGGATGHAGSIPGSGRSPGGGHDNPLQHSCLENPMDRGAWQSMGSQELEDPLEEGMATHSSTLAWEIPWTEEPGSPWGERNQRGQ